MTSPINKINFYIYFCSPSQQIDLCKDLPSHVKVLQQMRNVSSFFDLSQHNIRLASLHQHAWLKSIMEKLSYKSDNHYSSLVSFFVVIALLPSLYNYLDLVVSFLSRKFKISHHQDSNEKLKTTIIACKGFDYFDGSNSHHLYLQYLSE